MDITTTSDGMTTLLGMARLGAWVALAMAAAFTGEKFGLDGPLDRFDGSAASASSTLSNHLHIIAFRVC